MTERIIPIADARYQVHLPTIPEVLAQPAGLLADTRGRGLHDLRVSVTDRCNFRCTYCMPRSVFDKDYAFLPQSSLLSFEEITRLTRLFVAHGVKKLRLTGGEPLLRKNLERLIEQLARMDTAPGKPLELTLTTNASLLGRKAAALKAAGLSRITISLDALDDAVFKRMNDAEFPVTQVLAGIEQAERVGFSRIKINMVVKRGVNDGEILPMARHFKGSGHILRFIEFMDVGASNGWRMDEVVPSREIIDRLDDAFGVEAVAANYVGEVAKRWRYRDGSGEVGVVSSVTQPFCGDCSRARLSTDGRLYTCLFATAGHDFRGLLRGRFSDEQIGAAIAAVWGARADNYSEIRTSRTSSARKIEMSYIGG